MMLTAGATGVFGHCNKLRPCTHGRMRQRLRQLRQALAAATDPEEIWHIKRRIAELTPMLTQMNELAELTEHYYDRGYWRDEKYTL